MRRRGFALASLCIWMLVGTTAWADKKVAPKSDSPDPGRKPLSLSGDEWDLTPTTKKKPGDKKKDPFDAPSKTKLVGWDDTGDTVVRKYPYLEHHGYFRLRTDLFWRAYLRTNVTIGPVERHFTSGFLPPLTENVTNNDPSSIFKNTGHRGATTTASANLRLRYSPTFHLSEGLRIHATFDILDNLVLGSTPDFHPNRPDAPLSVFSTTQAPVSGMRNSIYDAIRVKEVYGEWRMLFAMLRAGRMARHWGLGIVNNGGTCHDCDYGTYNDRVELSFNVWKFTFALGWDFVSEGPTSASSRTYLGQPYDLDQLDDVNQWTLEVLFNVPSSAKQKKEHKERLYTQLKPLFQAGLYFAYRRQFLDQSKDTSASGLNYNEYKFVNRNAWMLTSDFWFKLEWKPAAQHYLRVEFEGVFVYGKLGSTAQTDSQGTIDSSRTITKWGAALEAEYRWKQLTIGLNAGLASGDSARFFGVLDSSNFINDPGNKTISNFVFNRDYHIDMLLFREVIGAVTNAFYVQPHVAYDLFAGDEDSLGASLHLMYARALQASATPGNSPNLGFEFDLRIFYGERNKFRFEIEWGMLFPFAAFRNTPDFNTDLIETRSPKWATTIQGRFTLIF
ncbi:MAG: TIGR04551 family protein [Myxococcales bacterium]|nr:TIGR04551 family protein [Myxococcales bacterium]